ncbi:GNAT family N-acetyltransferase [Natronoglycomyces albus]|uniref:GNAT family N-acetyltransferase n=1 Tax=Natronoglycomyces albus TaxID=2811108 RepID=A0A895XTF7_9ACTN|nr:GNAT family N-acetyltransferase [Natronoglycomyces albus]QSB06589.1 GNAT family N-acetyltransferase [Natronoglycomyces albus]
MDFSVSAPVPFDVKDASAVDDLIGLYGECHAHDLPGIPSLPDHIRRAIIVEGNPGRASDIEVIRDGSRIIGAFKLVRFLSDNENLATVDVLVHPSHRGQGLDTILLDRALNLAQAHSRSEIIAAVDYLVGCDEDAAAERRLLESRGFTQSQLEGYHYADVDNIDDEAERAYYERARAKAEGYELLQWTGQVPREHMEPLLRLEHMILTEIPTGDLDLQAETFGVERSIERQRLRTEAGTDVVQTVVRDPDSGLYVGYTVLLVYAAPAEHAAQGITLIDPEHRGKGLGMWLKLANLRLLREHYPRVRLIETDTADVNAGMNAINKKLGFATRYYSEEYLKRA